MNGLFLKESFFPVSKENLFSFHERGDAFKLLSPVEDNLKVLSVATTLKPSEEIVRFEVKVAGVPLNFSMVHTSFSKPDYFVDEQYSGPFTAWRHTHSFIEGGWEKLPVTLLRDEIRYSHPFLPIVEPFVKSSLKKLFLKRHSTTSAVVVEDVKMNHKRVIVTGATGFIGRRLVEVLLERGADVVAFVRDVDKAKKLFGEKVKFVQWDFADLSASSNWKTELETADSLVHLAGTPLFSSRWSSEFKKEIERSRVEGTEALVSAILETKSSKLKSFISASAVGYYGLDSTRLFDESETPSDDFLARVCKNWELATEPLDKTGVRRALMRIGVVLGHNSGVMKEVNLPFKFGVGGVFGKSNGWINWIHLEDVVRIFEMAAFDENTKGPVNVCSPNPVMNKDFAYSVAKQMKRPCLMRYPTAILKLIIGPAANYASGGGRVLPKRLRANGYRFLSSNIDDALKNILRSK